MTFIPVKRKKGQKRQMHASGYSRRALFTPKAAGRNRSSEPITVLLSVYLKRVAVAALRPLFEPLTLF